MKLLIQNKMHVLVLMTMTVLGACSLGGPSKPVQYYVLSPQAGKPVTLPSGGQLPVIGVGPVSMPELYDRPQIVIRPDANRVELSEYDRWGSTLKLDVQHVLKENLIDRLGHDAVFGWPWQRDDTPVLQVTVQFSRFDGEPGKQAYLSGSWQILDTRDSCRLEVRRFDITQVPDGAGYAAFVAALSQALAQLSQEIAGQLALAVPGCQQDVSESAGGFPASRTD